MKILDKINSSDDLKKLSFEELRLLSDEIRDFLIENVSKTGGHIASNLGMVELSLAINFVYNPYLDRIVYDVGHQCYIHKIINGRKGSFETLRSLNGIAGFPKPSESDTDAYIAGHASNSISVAYGMAKARTLLGDNYNVCAVIGDGALTGGLAYEGLENVASSQEPIVIILNDNAMSIDSNVGGMNKLLQKMRINPDYFKLKRKFRTVFGLNSAFYLLSHNIKERLKKVLLKTNMFTDMGLEYYGPVDGHNVEELIKALNMAKEVGKPVLLHVITVKGKGVKYTSEFPDKYHGVGPFNPLTGEIQKSSKGFGGIFGEELIKLAENDSRIVAVTAAMASGTGLEEFSKSFPDRFFDVGICEEHAVSMCGGMAKQGMIPVFAVYSSFLQRSYDMLLHDISLLDAHIVLCVDRAGIVGQDGETHNGVFDVAFLSSVPNMTIFCPSNFDELRYMLSEAVYNIKGPAAIRYPRGTQGQYIELNTADETLLQKGSKLTIISYGIMINEVLKAASVLDADVIKLGKIKPNDFSMCLESISRTGRVIVVEDVCSSGCVGMQIMAAVAENKINISDYRLLNLGSGIVPHGKVEQLYSLKGIDSQGIINAAESMK